MMGSSGRGSRRRPAGALLLGLVLAATAALPAQAAPAFGGFTITDAFAGFGTGVNARGQVSGSSSIFSEQGQALLWDARSGIVDLGTLGGTFAAASG